MGGDDPVRHGLIFEGESEAEKAMWREKGWTLNFEPSIFDQALLTPLIRGPVRLDPKEGSRLQYGCLLLSIVIVLLVNVALQMVVVDKVIDMRDQARYELEYRLFGEGDAIGMCIGRESGELPIVSELSDEDPPSRVLDCTTTSISLLSNMSKLDIDGDGQWTKDEAITLGMEWEQKYQKNSVLAQLFRAMGRLSSHGDMLAQKAASLPGTSVNGTLNAQSIPMSWMEAEKHKLLLCAAVQPALCDNLEVRGVLPQMAPSIFPDAVTQTDRIRSCSETLDSYCVAAFGQLYKYYRDFGNTLCGKALYSWNDTLETMTSEYETWVEHVGGPHTQRDAVVSAFYQVFLFLILLVWWMIMLAEVRQIVDWCFVLFLLPSEYYKKDGEGRDIHVEGYSIHHAEDNIKIWSVPLHWKLFTVVFHLIPRTWIWARLSYYGSWFLITADNYGDLILNSVALAFLVEVDNLLYDAVMSKRDKDVHDKVQPVTIRRNSLKVFYNVRHKVPTHMLFLTCLVVFGAYFTQSGFIGNSPLGKIQISDGLNCVCQVEGRNCIGAQLLGGNASVREAYGNSVPAVPDVGSPWILWARIKDTLIPDFTGALSW
mmetsp:Transcript_55329/g.132014  ORF Transcript_55329/g.132014 Transcript_55329/m.132014 type:complete len:598 (-) Transcript_55329:154-1947(-)|eukprot:CAMPEP_0178388542 /NCGR_PEP_ID=MMETSP0689_2-20121128/9650_1 /TAXON_ID=160604 /ORGANISM="Amphidinium massartii, Strain CS-259" /LENGTH=597 /DNA_ID=CAMNT_0020008955 /DNA_START=77 /DNA_END=1870 /DNA_ORIENTATION=-